MIDLERRPDRRDLAALLAAPLAPPSAPPTGGPFGLPVAGFYWVRLEHGSGAAIDFDDPCDVVPSVPSVRGESYSLARGKARVNVSELPMVKLKWLTMSSTLIRQVESWWKAWGGRGKLNVLTFDRLSSMAGTWEYDNFNTVFTRAVCVTNPLEVTKPALKRAFYTLELNFRQDAVDA